MSKFETDMSAMECVEDMVGVYVGASRAGQAANDIIAKLRLAGFVIGREAAATPAPLDVDVLAEAIHDTYPELREFRTCDHTPSYGDKAGATECEYDARFIATRYAALLAAKGKP